MTDLVNYSCESDVVTLTLNNGKVNAISHEVLDLLDDYLDKAETEASVVVITGTPGMLSGGYDLNTMQSSMEAAIELVTKGSGFTRRLLAYPKPIIGACTGHAVAKGLFTLLCCDYRIGVTGEFKYALNEVAIGMTMHYAGLAMAKERIHPSYFERTVFTAETFNPDGALAAGMVDELVEQGELASRVAEKAEDFKKLNAKAFAGTKLKSRESLLQELDKAILVDSQGTL